MFRRDKAILHLHRRGIRLIEQEIGVTEMNLTEKEFVKFLSKFDEHPCKLRKAQLMYSLVVLSSTESYEKLL